MLQSQGISKEGISVRKQPTCGVELHKFKILAGQSGTGHHGITVSCAGVGGCTAEECAAITTARHTKYTSLFVM